MITYCPSCHTHFRVHAEQLAARAGQVRCGKCSRVFDALDHLIEETSPAPAARPKPEFVATPADAADVELAPELVSRETPESRAETPEAAMLLEPENIEPVTTVGASAFSFESVASAEPARPMRRWPWLLGALLLLLTLVAQVAYRYRTAVTLLFPEVKPYAAVMCVSLGCELPLPRRIEMMSIEASDLQADTINPSVMVLSATLKNRASFNQQHPLLELTLTDTQDQPVVRRVLAPQDYLGKTVNTQAGFAATAEIAIKVFIEGSQIKATGYRLYLFYP
jgi:predicted Zn finger-like uncharacterized protein